MYLKEHGGFFSGDLVRITDAGQNAGYFFETGDLCRLIYYKETPGWWRANFENKGNAARGYDEDRRLITAIFVGGTPEGAGRYVSTFELVERRRPWHIPNPPAAPAAPVTPVTPVAPAPTDMVMPF